MHPLTIMAVGVFGSECQIRMAHQCTWLFRGNMDLKASSRLSKSVLWKNSRHPPGVSAPRNMGFIPTLTRRWTTPLEPETGTSDYREGGFSALLPKKSKPKYLTATPRRLPGFMRVWISKRTSDRSTASDIRRHVAVKRPGPFFKTCTFYRVDTARLANIRTLVGHG